MIKTQELIVDDDCAYAISKYTTTREESESGRGTKDDWEHARSYAVEALNALLNANPQAFDHSARLDKVYQEKQYSKRSA